MSKPIVFSIDGTLEIADDGFGMTFKIKADKPIFLSKEAAQTAVDALSDQLMEYYGMSSEDWERVGTTGLDS
jgi:hypothetical protein